MKKSVVRTKMADALINAVHSRINEGYNTGKLGRIVLTNEAKGIGTKVAYRSNKKAAVSAVGK